MRHLLKLSSAAVIGGLLLSGCASTGMAPTSPTQSANSYQLPQAVYDGYWAMTSGINGEAAVVSFRDNMSYNYRFKCYVDGRFEQLGMEKYQLRPSATAMGLQYESEPVFSAIKVVKVEPKKSLILNQSFTDPQLQQALPNGQNYSYVYKSKLEPICR
ncbi:hypothetical protein [Psychrobacter lutiphocae]|uniref:hypothetical protein n=1 Tax=Psychrobacter lutiphocae TaxID=540500 RepID=UPI00036C0E26|nr:hypothetical protein [Psychrobacter lutiphocae]